MLVPLLHKSEIPNTSNIFRSLATNFTQPVYDKKQVYMNSEFLDTNCGSMQTWEVSTVDLRLNLYQNTELYQLN